MKWPRHSRRSAPGPHLKRSLWAHFLRRRQGESCMMRGMEEGRKRMLAIVAGILVARHLKTDDDLFDSKPSPRTESMVAAAVQWAERIMRKIDNAVETLVGLRRSPESLEVDPLGLVSSELPKAAAERSDKTLKAEVRRGGTREVPGRSAIPSVWSVILDPRWSAPRVRLLSRKDQPPCTCRDLQQPESKG